MLMAQNVTFTNQSNLLNPISGFNYTDCTVDMNGDFLDDVVRVTSNEIYIDFQQADGTFQQTAFTTTLSNNPDWSICAGDIDGNGFNDLLFGGGSAVSFVMASDDGSSYTETYYPQYIFSQRSTMADIDNDGHLDAFVCHDVDQSHPYRNDGDGNMILDQSLIETFDRPGNYAAIWTDYDNDGDIDLYITKCKGGSISGDVDRTNLLYQNNGDGTFSEVGEQAGIGDNAQSWATVFEDFDNDGDFDAFVVNHDFKNRFYENNGDGTFTDIIETTNINPNDLGAWENVAGDFNNDGYMDIFSELSSSLYLNNGDMTFTGTSAPVTPGAIGDLNEDGFLDIVRGNNLFINDGNDNNWIKINPIGFESNLNGIGARVELYGDWGRQIREVRAGQSFSPMQSLQIHFGIGQATAIEKVVVKWPSGIITVLEDPEINTTIDIQEAGCLLPPSSLTVNGSLDFCPGDSVELIAPDGFSYSWSNNDTTQSTIITSAGTYSAILTDTAGCLSISDALEVSIIEDIEPTIELDGAEFFCDGTVVTLTASDGINHSWSNGMTGQSIAVDDSGVFNVSIDAQCNTGQLSSESITLTKLTADLPVVTGTTIGQGETAEITATGDNLVWYDQETGGNLIGSGSPFTTPSLDVSTTYYVAAQAIHPGITQQGGKLDDTGSGGLSTTASYIFFDAWEDFTLTSVDVYIPNNGTAGERTVQLYDNAGILLEEMVVDLDLGWHTLELNFDIPEGTGYTLRNPEANLFRNNGGVSYPYAIGDVGEVTTSLFGNGFYYYFYNWMITKDQIACPSERVSVTIEVTDAHEVFTQAGFGIYPNPATDNLSVQMNRSAEGIAIMDAQGKAVIEQTTSGQTTMDLEITSLAPGIYFIRITADGTFYHTKFVKE